MGPKVVDIPVIFIGELLPKWALYKPLNFVLNKKLSLVIDTIVEDNFQNQAYPDYIAFDSYLNEIIIFNLVTNTIVDEIFNIIRNLVYPDSISCDFYFNGLIALNTIVDGIIVSTNFNIIPSQVYSCNSYFNNPIIFNTEVGNGVYPENIVYDSDSNKLLIFNIEADNQIFPDSNKLLILNLANNITDNTFDIQNPIFPDFNKLITQGFQTWKESWNEKILLV
jgi:hypothetical protein